MSKEPDSGNFKEESVGDVFFSSKVGEGVGVKF